VEGAEPRRRGCARWEKDEEEASGLERTPGLVQQLNEEHGQELLELVHGSGRTEK
jgi:hypothetical protein